MNPRLGESQNNGENFRNKARFFLIFSNADLNTSVLQMDCAVTIRGTLRFMSLSKILYPFTFQSVHLAQFRLYWTVLCRGGTGKYKYTVLLTRWDGFATDRGPKLFEVSLSSWFFFFTSGPRAYAPDAPQPYRLTVLP